MFDVKSILQNQETQVELWHQEAVVPPKDDTFMARVALQHHFNIELWHQEDMARDTKATDEKIAQVKRAIDQLNQKRNDMIEQLDEHIIGVLRINQAENPKAPLNSETPGSVIDRLSISALKIFHMDEEIHRADASEEHRARCQGKMDILREQRYDLGECLAILLEDLFQGRKFLKVYRQMKMYNDETLNPILYQKQK